MPLIRQCHRTRKFRDMCAERQHSRSVPTVCYQEASELTALGLPSHVSLARTFHSSSSESLCISCLLPIAPSRRHVIRSCGIHRTKPQAGNLLPCWQITTIRCNLLLQATDSALPLWTTNMCGSSRKMQLKAPSFKHHVDLQNSYPVGCHLHALNDNPAAPHVVTFPCRLGVYLAISDDLPCPWREMRQPGSMHQAVTASSLGFSCNYPTYRPPYFVFAQSKQRNRTSSIQTLCAQVEPV
ncbi:uncharacterized protein K460DRAFT_103655 [Cucurbitaria berberidis CBS 394.84]|uniref:Uncharacterized protein n=1 Tax=Cucurbitaria berberidis CBS 394.84 TaxID=1168544 RepID=A0A9P4GGD7_9PLEO|nr:uncharacterized protein K460DRAFT_103655 [Cucurbitaria berberidis CBS 394.84]KAF1845132.1 hypothetical protein K460DRAFT_103655 [Cucurbitaria berberidis CBS 394.84]